MNCASSQDDLDCDVFSLWPSCRVNVRQYQESSVEPACSVYHLSKCVLVFLSMCMYVALLLLLDAVSSSHDPVGSNQRSPTSVPPLSVPLVLKRDLETGKEQTETTVRRRSWMERWMAFADPIQRVIILLQYFPKPQGLTAKKQMPNAGLPVHIKTLTDVYVLAYLPGPAVGLGIFSIDHTGSQGLNRRGAAPKGCRRTREGN